MNTKVQMLQEELNVLRTYMDKEYPVKVVQIAFMHRSIRNLKEEQQVKRSLLSHIIPVCKEKGWGSKQSDVHLLNNPVVSLPPIRVILRMKWMI